MKSQGHPARDALFLYLGAMGTKPYGTAMQTQDVMTYLRRRASARNVEGMARYGINRRGALGVPMPVLRALARRIGPDHALAERLWRTGGHEARILAGLIAEPMKLTGAWMEHWVRGFDSWDVCDQVCSNLFDKSPMAWAKARVWAGREEEFVKRAGFVLMAALSVHDKKAPDAVFRAFFPLIRREARDERNFVKKAVNWALRQIGKRNERLRVTAIKTAQSIRRLKSRSARWIAADALRELNARKSESSKAVKRRRIKKRNHK